MQGVLFGLVMLGVGWLVLWVCVDRSQPSNIWWPFDYRESDPVTPKSDQQEPDGRLQRTRRNRARPWNRSGS